MIDRDPLGEMCEDIVNTLTYIAKVLALYLRQLYLEIKREFIPPYYALLRAYYTGYFFIAQGWNHLYWRHFYMPLYLLGLVPEITDDYVEKRYARLRSVIEDTQFNDDPRVQEAKTNARAILDEYEKR